ncbi:MAG: hypothetical protein Ct9H300mP28_07970 [Pseudomonadota bacterium]|nr:MAG: hypothetical protein Ct9H300mP28_07970 [Pseudomonadota bacterium]
MIIPAKQYEEIGSDYYHGGLLFPNHASLDPPYITRDCWMCIEQGVKIKDRCAVNRIERQQKVFCSIRIQELCGQGVGPGTSGTPVQLHLATRRVIPIGSYIIPTEELEEELVDLLIPKNRVITDTRKLVVYYRASPDRKRILFGGRVPLKETDPNKSVGALHSNS